jgi:hypothetical protein
MRALFIGIVGSITILMFLFRAALQPEMDIAPNDLPLASVDVAPEAFEPQAPVLKTVGPEVIEESVGNAGSLSISVGAVKDPSDELIFVISAPVEPLEIGESLDPDDLSKSGVVYASSINVGEAAEPESTATWIQSDGAVVIEVGEAGEPTESWFPSQDRNQTVLDVGEPLEIDAMSTL